MESQNEISTQIKVEFEEILDKKYAELKQTILRKPESHHQNEGTARQKKVIKFAILNSKVCNQNHRAINK